MNNNEENEDRGMLKWQPFYSVLSEKEIKDSAMHHEEISKPDLSEDQIKEMENIILEAYNNHLKVNLDVYSGKNIRKIAGNITKIDTIHRAIFVDKKMVLFDNIIKINIA